MKGSFYEKLVGAIRESRLLTNEQVDEVIEAHKKSGGSIGRIIIDKGLMNQKDILLLLSRQLNIPPIDLSRYKVAPEIVKLIPEKTLRQYKIFPISVLGNKITVAMSDPTNVLAEDDIRAVTKMDVDIVIASENDIDNAISNFYKADSDMDIASMQIEGEDVGDLEIVADDEKVDISEVSSESNKAPIVKLVSMILNEALSSRASDIHIEPQEKMLRVRYRVDGRLVESLSIPKRSQNAIIARLKIMSNMDITENRIPQDGRFRIAFREKEIDFRVSVLPITFGNKVVMRALDKSSLGVGLDKLGLFPEALLDLKTAISRPYGMILITGPTGSGKSTTLYSILNQLNTPERNIVTIEDPVEYQLEGITQIQANSEIGLSFSTGLKSILRQSPDIVMVGEIRDSETADIAIKASLTGQLVLSTLHTNDAPSAITRLIDMGVEPFLIASSVILTAAQRLCRKICDHCKEAYTVPDAALKKAGLDPEKVRSDKVVFYHGRGCPKCKNSGYHGRMAILETFLITDEIRSMISKKMSADQIKRRAVEKGMKTLRDNAIKKFLMGQTTLEEVLSITSEE